MADRSAGDSFLARATPPLRAMSDLCSAVNFLVRASPPFEAPSFAKATAGGFFFRCSFLSPFLRERLGINEKIFVRENEGESNVVSEKLERGQRELFGHYEWPLPHFAQNG